MKVDRDIAVRAILERIKVKQSRISPFRLFYKNKPMPTASSLPDKVNLKKIKVQFYNEPFKLFDT